MKKLLLALALLLMMLGCAAAEDAQLYLPTGGYIPPMKAVTETPGLASSRLLTTGVVSYDSSISVSHSGSYVTGNTVTWTISGVSEGIFYLTNNPVNNTYEALLKIVDSTTFSYTLMEPGQYCVFVCNSSGKALYSKAFTVTGKDLLAARAAEIMADCPYTDDYHIALWAHDWLYDHCEYDYDYVYHGPETMFQSPWTGVCDSYSKAYVALMTAAGLDCERVISFEINHAWNVVKMDGDWYQVDATWDDTLFTYYPNVPSCHLYFAMTDALFQST